MRKASIVRVLLRRAGLRRPFPLDFAARIEGQPIRAVERRGKYLLVALSSGDTLVMHLGMSGSFRVQRATSRSRDGHDAPCRQARSRRLRVVEWRDRHLQRSTPFRRDGRHRGASGGRAGRRRRPGARAAVARIRCGGAGGRVRGETCQPESGAARSAGRRRGRQHLRERGAAPRRVVANAARLDNCDGRRSAQTSGGAAGRGDQSGLERRDRATGATEPQRQVSGLRTRRRAMSPARVRRQSTADNASGAIHLLLSEVPEMTGTAAPRFLHVANGTCTTDLIVAAGIPGAVSIWADPLYEGPVPGGLSDDELLDVRAGFLGSPDADAFAGTMLDMRRVAAGDRRARRLRRARVVVRARSLRSARAGSASQLAARKNAVANAGEPDLHRRVSGTFAIHGARRTAPRGTRVAARHTPAGHRGALHARRRGVGGVSQPVT